MKISKTLAITLLLSSLLCLTQAFFEAEHHHQGPHICNHDKQEFNPDFVDFDDDPQTSEYGFGRMLTSSYNNIRITPIYDTVRANTPADYLSYLKNQLAPPVISILQKALKAKYPLTSPLKVTSKTVCGYTTPSSLSTGINADFAILFDATTDTSGSWVASTTHCVFATGVSRPIVVNILINMYATPIEPTTNPLRHEYNIYTLLHEAMHGLGISAAVFNYYVDSSGNFLKNHVKSVTLSGTTRTVLDLAPLTAKLQSFYGCSTLQGMFMENDGGSGTALSHFERRFFEFDTMSSGGIHGRRLTQFDLAYLEGTGWYIPDYSFAEPFFFGQGQGCSFINTCTAPAVDDDTEGYCAGTGRGCTDTGISGGYCVVESLSDGCRWYKPQFEYGCMNENGTYYTPFASKQAYGVNANSRCFSGNLSTSGTVSQTTYCLTFTCVGSGSSTVLKANWGSTVLTCTQKGKISVSGYSGGLNCPDPIQFCNTIAPSYCPRSCSGRGTCVNNKCVCDSGFINYDCGMSQ